MPIVIDDFQVEAATPEQRQRRGGGEEAAGGNGGGGKQPEPEEIECALRAQAERAARVWAH